MLLHAPTYLTNRSVRSLRASSLWRSGGRSAEIEPLIPSPSLARFWSIPDRRDNAIIRGFFDASFVFHCLSLVTIGFTTTLPMMRFGPFRKGLCWSGKGKSTFEFSNISSMQRLLNENPIFNVVNYRLWVIPKNDVAFCSGFGTYHNQSSFILPAKRTATSLVWLWFTTITREYNRLIFRAFCSFPSLPRVKLKS